MLRVGRIIILSRYFYVSYFSGPYLKLIYLLPSSEKNLEEFIEATEGEVFLGDPDAEPAYIG